MNIHIIPLNDLKPHEEKSTCACGPRAQIINGSQLIIHNSYDGREGVELAQEVLAKVMCNHPGCMNEANCTRNKLLEDTKCMDHCDCRKYAYPEEGD